MKEERPLILVTGATGYVGGRIVPRLLEEGYSVRCLARHPERLQGRDWAERVEIVPGDVMEPETLLPALQGARAAYYLVHAMGGGPGFHRRDLRAARNFAEAAAEAGLERILYLGGLGDPASGLSEHLRSRQEVGAALGRSGVPVTEFRASVIVGSGSLSFEMVRHLTERIPVMICPRWVFTRVQPIAVEDVLAYLVAALEVPESAGRIVEIGGDGVMTYGEMMKEYARARRMRRLLIPVPVLTPRLSSYWVHWFTPIPASIVRPLAEGLRNETVVRDPLARRLFPEIRPVSYDVAVRRALAALRPQTSWSDSLASSRGNRLPVVLEQHEGMILERRSRSVAAAPEDLFRTFTGIGGKRGWFHAGWLWRIRGALDRVLGGVGLRRGRRDPDRLRVGDALDFWRVEALEAGRLLRLRAEMKLPGGAWLQFQAMPREEGGAMLEQTAFFAPRGLFGLLYWYLLYPLHAWIFGGLAREIARRAEKAGNDEERPYARQENPPS